MGEETCYTQGRDEQQVITWSGRATKVFPPDANRRRPRSSPLSLHID